MPLSRLALAFVISLRAVLIYGEAAGATSAELSWRQLLPPWRVPRGLEAAQAPARAMTGPTA